MRAKKFNKKLILNKKTVANLNEREMKKVYGGIPPTWWCHTTSMWICCH